MYANHILLDIDYNIEVVYFHKEYGLVYQTRLTQNACIIQGKICLNILSEIKKMHSHLDIKEKPLSKS